MGLFDTVIGRDDLIRYLRSLGYEVRPAITEEKERLGGGWLKGDHHCIAVAGRPFEMISLRNEGWVGPWDSLRHGGGSFKIGGVPVKSRTVLPLKTHYLFFCEPRQAHRELTAELRLRKEGIVRRKVVGGYWEGGRLAAVLNMDRPTLDALVANIGPSEKLTLEPDHGAGCVRLVHRSVRVIDFSLFKKNLVSFHNELCPPEMLEAFERVVGHARDYVVERLS
jgi:hypothetical protein